jgi:hypothetical protein
MSDRWLCVKCNTWNPGIKSRCGFCSQTKPGAETQDLALEKITKDLHNTIEKLTSKDKKRMWRWLEDNVL